MPTVGIGGASPPSEPLPTCTPLPVVPATDGGAAYASRLEAARAILRAVAFEPKPGAEVTGNRGRIEWTRTCGVAWLRWRGEATERADELLKDAFRAAASPSDRADAVVASGEAWASLLESLLRVLQGAEPNEWRSDAEMNKAFLVLLRPAVKEFLENGLGPAIAVCVHVATAMPQQRACEDLQRRKDALVGAVASP